MLTAVDGWHGCFHVSKDFPEEPRKMWIRGVGWVLASGCGDVVRLVWAISVRKGVYFSRIGLFVRAWCDRLDLCSSTAVPPPLAPLPAPCLHPVWCFVSCSSAVFYNTSFVVFFECVPFVVVVVVAVLAA